jgi:multicomponent K+:H+ antiporter subunit D
VSHWIVAPVLVPALTAVALIFAARAGDGVRRGLSLLSILVQLGVAVALLQAAAEGPVEVYALGNWPVPFGILLVLDRLSALMVVLTAVVGLGTLAYASRGWDTRGRNFHALFHFQLMGLSGAFLTGDVFNLFVFFEVLLIASYGLLLHGGGRARLKAGIHYVVINLLGSALFLVGLAVLYGSVGSLNLAHIATRIPTLDPSVLPLARTAGWILLVVFAIKAAAVPLYFWLPQAYAAASAPVAALFAIMTKVGVYAILRVFAIAYGAQAGVLEDMVLPVLLVGGLVTLGVGYVGAMAAKELRTLLAYLVVASVGTLMVALGIGTREAVAGGLYYLVHSTVATAGLFLLAELIRNQRGEDEDRLVTAPGILQPILLGGLFLVGAMAIVGLPPLSGFVGKVLVLRSAVTSPAVGWVFGVVLGGSLLGVVALGRAGSTLFWKSHSGLVDGGTRVSAGALLPVVAFLGLSAAMVVGAGPIYRYADAAAADMVTPSRYIEGVMTGGPDQPEPKKKDGYGDEGDDHAD